jgi:hypothetical protein
MKKVRLHIFFYAFRNFVNFWFYFVRPNKRLLEQEKIDLVWKQKIVPKVDYYISRRCEKGVYQIIERLELPFELEKVGRYWNKDVEIDIVGFDAKRENYLCSEIKWQNQPVDISIFNEFKDKIAKEKEFYDKKNSLCSYLKKWLYK